MGSLTTLSSSRRGLGVVPQLTLATTADSSVTVTLPAITNVMTDAQCEALLTASVPALTNTTAAGYVAPYYAPWDADATLDAASTGTCNGGYAQSALLIGASAQTRLYLPQPPCPRLRVRREERRENETFSLSGFNSSVASCFLSTGLKVVPQAHLSSMKYVFRRSRGVYSRISVRCGVGTLQARKVWA